MDHDVGHYLGGDFRGEYLDRFVSAEPKPNMPLYHLVGALDPIFDSDIGRRIGDGLPETLSEWILADGLTHIKIKLNGDNMDWDVSRMQAVERAASAARRGVARWFFRTSMNGARTCVTCLSACAAQSTLRRCSTASTSAAHGAEFEVGPAATCKAAKSSRWSSTNRWWIMKACWQPNWATPASRSRRARARATPC
jgi:hypothetical protein